MMTCLSCPFALVVLEKFLDIRQGINPHGLIRHQHFASPDHGCLSGRTPTLPENAQQQSCKGVMSVFSSASMLDSCFFSGHSTILRDIATLTNLVVTPSDAILEIVASKALLRRTLRDER